MGSPTLWSLLSLCWPLWSAVSGSGYGASYVLFVFQGNGSSSSAEEVEPVWECDAYGANFGFQLPADKELLACVQPLQPLQQYACHGPLEPPAHPPRNASLHCPDFFALADRGNCTFGEKARLVQDASEGGSPLFTGLIVENSLDKPPTPMSAPHATDITIPLYMIENSCAERLRNTFPFDRGYYVVIRNAGLGSIVRYLIPFIVVLGLAFIVLLIITIVKFVRDRRRRQRRRLSSRNLRKLPTKKYKKAEGEEAETCPICLDDFEDGEKLRVLPCNHAYHCKCVDPWLTKNRKVCPVCKRKVCPSKDDSSDSESEDTAAAAPTNSSNVEPQGTGDEEQLLPAANPPPSALRRVLPGFLRRGREPVAHPPPQSPIEEVPSQASLSQATDEEEAGGAFSDLPQPDVATRQPRRKRHPATVSGRNVPRPGPNRMSLVQSPPDEAETSGADPSRQRAATHVLPPPIPTQAPSHHQNHPHRMRPRHRNAAASAPAHLRDPLEDEEEAINPHQQQSRDDSIAIDLDQAPPQV